MSTEISLATFAVISLVFCMSFFEFTCVVTLYYTTLLIGRAVWGEGTLAVLLAFRRLGDERSAYMFQVFK